MSMLSKAIYMRLEDIQEEKKQLREMLNQLTKEQQELIARLERLEEKRENGDPSAVIAELGKNDSGWKDINLDVPADNGKEKTVRQKKSPLPNAAAKNDYILPTDPEAVSEDGTKRMSYKELTRILIDFAKEHNNQVDHEAFEQYLIDTYDFTPKNFSQIIWRARKEDSRLRSLISGSRKITVLDTSMAK
ncbi:hypothetical protein GCM10007216_31110 [Thalassobacillus devorans]|uniref:Uncharacterized protein n=1 Tax=Thalassobacillus devorans TaxID=279813 RepID=A0ABQ1PJD3_9BACI|nr:hypothetical protein [Thalassobacillus devorans]NIK30070.1 HPt (histidine-containing phosphotransfer) domain-containing protein [Thalassobacillus devorans]GGC98115.1 hypothetical protein GCM10007216_31110 [Thalassobacillus devorans]